LRGWWWLWLAVAVVAFSPATGGAQERGVELLRNPGFEGKHEAWPGFIKERRFNSYAVVWDDETIPVHSGERAAWLGGYHDSYDLTLQAFRLTSGAPFATVEFYVFIDAPNPDAGAEDSLRVVLQDGVTRDEIAEVASFDATDATSGWVQVSVDVGNMLEHGGKWLRLLFFVTTEEDTSFYVDDASVTALPAPSGAPLVQATTPQPEAVAGHPPEPAARVLSERGRVALAAETGGTVRASEQTGAAVSFRGRASAALYGGEGLPPEDAALAFLTRYGGAFGLQDAATELALLGTSEARGESFVRFQQVHEGVEVEGHQLVVQVDGNGDVLSALGKALPGITAPSIPAVTADAALAQARAATDAGSGTAELVVYSEDGRSSRLAWRVALETGRLDSRPVLYVDAESGETIASFETVAEARDRRTYDYGCPDGGLPGQLVRSEGDPPVGDPVVDAAHDHAGLVYDFYWETFSRDSIDGEGMAIRSTAHYEAGGCDPYNNAFWTGSQIVYGDGDGILYDPFPLSVDIVAHELTHGVTQHTAGLNYSFESGALNESFSDVFASLLVGDPQIAEDIYTPPIAGDALRDMEFPWTGSDPQPSNWYEYIDLPGGSDLDNGGVHINSGIANHIFWNTRLLIGPEQAAQIYYDALANRLSSGSSFEGARDALVAAAADIYGEDVAGDVLSVWTEAGVGQDGPGHFQAYEGWNLIAGWPGPPLVAHDETGDDQISDYFDANSDPNVWTALAVYADGAWGQRFSSAPLPAFQTLDLLEPGDDLWVSVSEEAVITLP
jgi:Zn-dependent metalloprotease